MMNLRFHLLLFMMLFATLLHSAEIRSAKGQTTEGEFSIEQRTDRLVITCGDKPVATYVFHDPHIPRPYLAHVHGPSGRQVTRNHPPVMEEDRTDHAELHPGIWLSFGDLNGGDFWRNKDQTIHERFVAPPTTSANRARFAVRNRYQRSDGTLVCHETCKLTFINSSWGYIILWDSTFSSDTDFYFGDQEEMGLGIRVSTPISVEQSGNMLDSQGRRNEKEIWGQTADWCDYSGHVDGQHIGMTVMCHPKNFRACWMHSRDYGFLAANPFGRQAFRQGEASKVIVQRGDAFRLRYGILLHSSAGVDRPDLAAAYTEYVQLEAE